MHRRRVFTEILNYFLDSIPKRLVKLFSTLELGFSIRTELVR